MIEKIRGICAKEATKGSQWVILDYETIDAAA